MNEDMKQGKLLPFKFHIVKIELFRGVIWGRRIKFIVAQVPKETQNLITLGKKGSQRNNVEKRRKERGRAGASETKSEER